MSKTMKKILMIGKLNDTVKDLNTYLSKFFHVQLCSENKEAFFGMLEIVNPDLVFISLIGAYDIDISIFRHLETEYHQVPVMTLGTEKEKEQFLKFYEDKQFENLTRPISNEEIYESICKKLKALYPDEQEPEEKKKKKVLLVDDNPSVLRSVRAMLASTYKVMLANSGAQAMTSIGREKPDLILLDYEMPVCDGKQTLEMIRADEEIADIPVIFLTGVNDREHIEAVLKLKPSGYVLKPPVKERLMEEMEKAFDL